MIDLSFLEDNFAGNCNISGVLLIRHAERENICSMESQQLIPLTENGIHDSVRFGDALKNIKHNIIGLKSSPVNRCMKTLESIAMGANINTEIKVSKNLGNPGPFVYDDILAREAFSKRSNIELANMQISGKQFSGMMYISDGCKLIIDEIMSDLNMGVGVHIYVTHDAVICPFAGFLTEKLFDLSNWIGYLNGVVLFKKENRFFLMWSGNIHDITYKLRSLISDE